jgi:two-component system chemotaxis response regulator CheY
MTADLSGKRVVVLDASPVFRNAIQTALGSRGAEVIHEVASDSGLLTIIRTRPDLVVTAVELGVINGYDLCLILKLMPDYAHIPIILISSGEADVVARKAADAGADHYVRKDNRLVAEISRLADRIFGLAPAAAPPRRGPIRSVLVVDDSRIMRKIIINILRTLDIPTIREADHGLSGLEQLAQAPADLVITDWNMPRMNGLDFVKAIRSKPEYDHTLLAMVTTESGQDDVAAARAAGVTGYLCKPFSVQSMKDMIAGLRA